ncbi:PREDICTED: aspartic proteinase CDR1-like isoform X2 [Lupinus angustifolius]|uniref:aspartic proteinase CDR1-like isoform X2 n=1 Tax=Lupinus angustifolius TaxID=3871 RepID=UPI00092E9C29|nr:PREDICTED: aspartic proteinase CDR1-like isoform X2 [Lupinus angustifolius]
MNCSTLFLCSSPLPLFKPKHSLINSSSSSFGSKKFSQCLVPFHSDISISSKMSFGDGSDVLGDGVVSTPLVIKEDNTPYFVTLLGISVGDTYIPFNISSKGVEKGNIFIDSGTPPTILPQQLYDKVVNEVRNQVALEPIENDQDLGSQLCYRTTIIEEVPLLIAHFEGADVQLTSTQTFIPPKDGVLCLGLTNTSSDGGIYGNFAQSNYLIGFDLERQIVSFKPVDCTKQ